jgi:hypothetical protein
MLIIFFCGCQENANSSIKTTTATTNKVTEQTTETQSKIKVKKFKEINAEDIYTHSASWSASGGRNSDYSETTPLVYNGKEMTMHIKLNMGTSEREGMGVYLNVNGFFLNFSIQEYSDENFNQPITEESKNDVFHQLIFEPNENTENDERYFVVKFNPNMFGKGETVYPTIIGNVNNSYMPANMKNISSTATSVFAVFPPTLNINAEKEQTYKVSNDFYKKDMPEDFNEENQSNVVNVNLTAKNSTGKNYIKVKRGAKIKMTAQAYTLRDEYGEYADRDVMLSVLVNDRPVSVFDKTEYLKLSVNKNEYYNRDFIIDTSKLLEQNRVQLFSCQFGSAAEGNTFIMTSDVFYIEVTE